MPKDDRQVPTPLSMRNRPSPAESGREGDDLGGALPEHLGEITPLSDIL